MRSGVLILTAMLLVEGCSSTDSNTDGTNYIDVENFDFAPANATVSVGSDMTVTVTFVWVNGADGHKIHFDSGPAGTLPPDSQALPGGSTYDATLHLGTYTYHCLTHPAQMQGTIVAQVPSAGM